MSLSEIEINETDIAIIGMALRTPGADNVEQFWDILLNSYEVVSDYVALDEKVVLESEQNLGSADRFVKANTAIKGIDLFDAEFFDIRSNDAAIMDPQQRLFLECAWEALENAGYDVNQYSGTIGLYGGVYANYYLLTNLFPSYNDNSLFSEMQMMISNEKDHATTFIAYKMNLNGPVVTVQSACSTSLAAVHMACESLLTYSSDIILAGAATVTIPQRPGYYYYEGGILSKDGHCRPYDANASGTIYSDGVGVVVLKRLSDAVRDGDNIYAVIKGSAMNNDGSMRVGYSAPGVKGQIEVITRAHMVSGVNPETITYIEGHGTGTPLGDRIELEALHQVFTKRTKKKGFCALGSVKSNIGHLGPASGVCGLIKTVLSIKNAIIPPSLNFETPNEYLDSFDSPFYVNTVVCPWVTEGYPRRAGVSSFGLGGTNVHVVLEEAPEVSEVSEGRKVKLFSVSARTYSALRKKLEDLLNFLKKNPEMNSSDISYTLHVGRKAFEHRCFMAFEDINEVIETIENNGRGFAVSYVKDESTLPIFFVFGGECRVRYEIINQLCNQEKGFRRRWNECCTLIRNTYNIDIGSVCNNNYMYENKTVQGFVQFALQYALAGLWKDWGIEPKGLIGFGIGLYVCGCIADIFSLEEAIEFVRLYCCVNNDNYFSVESKDSFLKYNQFVKKVNYRHGSLPVYTFDTFETLYAEETHNYNFWENVIIKKMEHSINVLNITAVDRAVFIVMNDIMSLNGMLLLDEIKNKNCSVYASIGNSEKAGIKQLYEALGYVWLKGVNVNWYKFYKDEKRRRVPLPTYPFERKRYWVEEGKKKATLLNRKRSVSYLFLKPDQLKNYVPPRNEIEDIIAEIWEDSLGIKPVGIKDNFFELGGNSLIGAAIHMHIKDVFDIDMDLRSFFENQTVESMAQFVKNKQSQGI